MCGSSTASGGRCRIWWWCCPELQGWGVAFRSLTEAIDTESAAGRLMGHILGALAEFERSLIVERTQAGLKAAKQRGAKLGRKPSLSEDGCF